MILVQTIISSLPFSVPPIFWKTLNTSAYFFGILRAQEAYGMVLGKFLSDHKDVLAILLG